MISVIIPTANEAGELPATLASLAVGQAQPEVLVVDAGSADGTPELAKAAGARVLSSPRRQRAAQMNLGAAAARGEILLFLHADTWLNANSLAAIERALARPGVVGGAFARRFAHLSRLLRLTCRLADWRGCWPGWFFGDQAIFARRAAFARLGGFREWDAFEDLDFSRRLRRLGWTVLLRPAILSSARRFQGGVARRVVRDFWLTCRYLAGADPQALAAELRRPR
jgi:rSAM/selenodomain-associated transferase 2